MEWRSSENKKSWKNFFVALVFLFSFLLSFSKTFVEAVPQVVGEWNIQTLTNANPTITGMGKYSAYEPSTNLLYITHNQGIFKWNPVTRSSGGNVQLTVPAVGVSFSNTTTRGWTCGANRKVFSFPITTGNVQSTQLTQHYTSPDFDFLGIQFAFCVFDWSRNYLYIGKTASNSIERIDIEPKNINWNGNYIQTETIQFPDVPVSWAQSNDSLWVAFADQRIIQIDKNNPDLTTAVLKNTVVGVGSYNALGLDVARGFLYVGSDLGIGFKLRLPDLGLDNFLFVPGYSLLTLTTDSRNGVLYFGAVATDNSQGGFLRVNMDKFTVDITNNFVATRRNIRSIAFVNETYTTAWISSDTGTPYLQQLSVFNCSDFNTCTSCINGDSYYCGWCPSSAFSCTTQLSCFSAFPSLSWNNNLQNCPQISGVSPSSGSTNGNTRIRVGISQGVFLANATQCVFRDSSPSQTLISRVNPLTLTSNFIECLTPPKTTANSSILVTVEFNQRPWTSNAPFFTYYNCSESTNCGDCLTSSSAKPECGWCLRGFRCAANTSNVCNVSNSEWTQFTCPQMISVNPGSTSSTGKTVQVTGNYFIAASDYSCQFNFTSVPALFTSPTSVNCSSPPNPTGFVPLRLFLGSQPYSQNSLPFLYYNCSEESSCSSCLDPLKPDCLWCFSTSQCVSGTGSSCPSLDQSCPALIGVNPSSGLVASGPLLTITTSGRFLTSSNYQCKFSVSSTNFTLTNATWFNSTTLQCPAPSLPPGSYSLQLLHLYKVYSLNSLTFTYFDCQSQSCGSCLDPAFQGGCSWCSQENSCKVTSTASCSSGLPLTQCPYLGTISPSSGSILGNTTVFVSSSFFSSSEFQCLFVGNSVSYNVSGIFINQTSLKCVTPNITLPGNYSLILLFRGVPYTPNSLPFLFYDCGMQSGCEVCNTLAECNWCLGPTGCTNVGVCSSPNIAADFCPKLISVNPPYCRPLGGRSISVIGDRYVSSGSYKCVFGDVSVSAVYQNSSLITCECPLRPTLGDVNITIVRDNLRYFPEQSTFTYFECNSSAVSCSSCATKICGFCYSDGYRQCLEIELCPDFNLWTNSCPRISEVTPPHASLLSDSPSNVLLQVKGNSFMSSLNLGCLFWDENNVGMTGASVVNSSLLTCLVPSNMSLPSNTSSLLANMTIVETNTSVLPFTENSFLFTFLDCSLFSSSCEKCFSGPPQCAWCLASMQCVPSFECSGNSTTVCPTLSYIDPVLGSSNGGTLITITGTLFIPDINITFGDQELQTTFVDYHTLTTVTPRGVNAVPIKLVRFGKPYAAQSLAFTFSGGSEVKGNNNVLLNVVMPILVAVLGGLLILAVIIFIIIYKKRKTHPPFQVELAKLPEPDFQVYAFDQEIAPMYTVSKKMATSLETLQKFLVRKDNLGFVDILCGITQATESERVAKSLVYTFEESGKGIELIKEFITREIDEVLSSSSSFTSEITVFRPQSFASKMFKFYSKMVGLKYLWNTFGVFVNEIVLTTRDENSKGPDRLLPPSFTEYDIEIDPNKMLNTDDETINKLQLLLITSKVFKAITTSVAQFPLGLRVISKFIFQHVQTRFADNKIANKNLASFLFLRFLCPALTAPHAYGLAKAPPNENSQRKLILVSKILQNLANGIQFGKKEEYMTKMNEFISDNLEKLYKFLAELIDVSEDSFVPATEVPKTVNQNSMAFLHHHISNKHQKVNSEFDRMGGPNNQRMRVELEQILDEMGSVAPKIEK